MTRRARLHPQLEVAFPEAAAGPLPDDWVWTRERVQTVLGRVGLPASLMTLLAEHDIVEPVARLPAAAGAAAADAPYETMLNFLSRGDLLDLFKDVAPTREQRRQGRLFADAVDVLRRGVGAPAYDDDDAPGEGSAAGSREGTPPPAPIAPARARARRRGAPAPSAPSARPTTARCVPREAEALGAQAARATSASRAKLSGRRRGCFLIRGRRREKGKAAMRTTRPPLPIDRGGCRLV